MKSNSSEALVPEPAPDGPAAAPGFLRWLANYGLSLSAVSFAVPGPGEAGPGCPFARLLEARCRKKSA